MLYLYGNTGTIRLNLGVFCGHKFACNGLLGHWTSPLLVLMKMDVTVYTIIDQSCLFTSLSSRETSLS